MPRCDTYLLYKKKEKSSSPNIILLLKFQEINPIITPLMGHVLYFEKRVLAFSRKEMTIGGELANVAGTSMWCLSRNLGTIINGEIGGTEGRCRMWTVVVGLLEPRQFGVSRKSRTHSRIPNVILNAKPLNRQMLLYTGTVASKAS